MWSNYHQGLEYVGAFAFGEQEIENVIKQFSKMLNIFNGSEHFLNKPQKYTNQLFENLKTSIFICWKTSKIDLICWGFL